MKAIQDYFVAENATVCGDVVFSQGVNVWYNCVIRGDLATITLAPRVNLQDGTIIHTDTDAPYILEEGVVVGHAAILHGKRIGKNSLVGMGATLLSGSDIGEECLIAAGTLITEGRKIPPRSLVMGAPGKIVREVTDEEIEGIRGINKHYLEMAQLHAEGKFPPPWNRVQD